MKGHCLNCTHFLFDTPADWKRSYEGQLFHQWNAISHIRQTQRYVDGKCTLFPTHTEHRSDHGCGQHDAQNHGELRELIWGTPQALELNELRKQVPDLKRQLKKAREVSASRLKRLKGEKR
jgi:hypothetical protein